MTAAQEIFDRHRLLWPMPATGLRARVYGRAVISMKPDRGEHAITVRVGKEQE